MKFDLDNLLQTSFLQRFNQRVLGEFRGRKQVRQGAVAMSIRT